MVEKKELSWAEVEALLEEEKRRKTLAFLIYMKMAAEAEQMQALLSGDDEKKREVLILACIMKNYLKESLTIHAQLQNREGHIRGFFTRDETPQQAERRENLLKDMNVKESEFFSLALASHSEKANFSEMAMDVFRGKDHPSEEMDLLRKNGPRYAEKALEELQAGRPELMEALLLSGLRVGCQQFANSRDPLQAMHWARHINSIVGIVNTHPVLFKDGLQDPLLTKAVECAAIGKVMESGYDALLEIQHAAITGEPLAAQRNRELTSRVLLMQDMDLKRTASANKLCLPAKFDPREGFPLDFFRSLQEKITSAPLFRGISQRSLEDQTLFLSGHATREILSRQLTRELELIPVVEKDPVQIEPPHISAPTLFR